MFILRTLHWRQVNDPAQISYLCYLIDHGMAPYRDLIEINMPGIYLVNWTVMHTLGEGSLAWRCFDLGLVLGAALAMVAIARPYDWAAGVFAGGLFILFHGRDGAGETGQRDLIIAVLLLFAYAFLFHAVRKVQAWPLLGFGMACGIAVTIKPIPLPFAGLLLLLFAVRWKKTGEPLLPPLGWAAAGLLLPFSVVLAFLVSQGSLAGFLHMVAVTLPYYAALGRRSPGALLKVGITSSMWTIAVLGLLAAFAGRERWDWGVARCIFRVLLGRVRGDAEARKWEIALLGLGVLFGLASYFAQGKGFPYHRYPLLAFLLLWASIQWTAALRGRRLAKALGVLGLGYGMVLAPIYLREASRIRWPSDFEDSLTQDLQRLGGASLSSRVQCLSTLAECHTALYRMHLVQSTGLFYDFLIFGQGDKRPTQESRALFWKQLQAHPPEVFVVNAVQFPKLNGYDKLEAWPLLHQYLFNNYVLYDDRSFSPGKLTNRAYRIYVRKSGS